MIKTGVSVVKDSILPTFDWYQFSTETPLKTLREIFEPISAVEPFKEVKPVLPGYAWSQLIGGNGGSLRIHYGGRNGDNFGANVQGTGPLSPQVADLFRAAVLDHKVGRADVRQDFLGDFDRCRLDFITRCDQAGMASSDAGSCPESKLQQGRTVYGGARSSFYRPTLYQKGLQLGDGHPAEYLRLEHRFTPTKSTEKAQLSKLTPGEMIGLRPVARDLSETVLGSAIAAYKLDRFTKEKTPYFWMLRQYQPTLREMYEDLGSWQCVGQQIGFDLEEMT